jgi:hypothetical protein
MVICLALTLALGGCKKSESAIGDSATQTIEPAKPQPDLTGSDAMTQTVDVSDGRTEAEGAGTETSATTATTTTTTTAAPPATTTTR